MADEPKVKSLYKALKVLECFLSGDPYKGVSDISRELDCPKSTVSNILATYQLLGFLEVEKRSGKYMLGPKALELSNRTYQSNNILQTMQSYMDDLAHYTNEEVLLAVCRDLDVVYIGMSCIRGGFSRHYVIGSRAPMYCTGIGKAMLFKADDEMLRRVFEKGTVPFTEHTILDCGRFRAHLEEQKRQGYAIDNMEHEYGIRCVAVPIRNQSDDIIAGLSISGPSLRMPDEKLVEYGARLKKVAEQASHFVF